MCFIGHNCYNLKYGIKLNPIKNTDIYIFLTLNSGFKVFKNKKKNYIKNILENNNKYLPLTNDR
jgi:hypothetical protein